MNPLLHPVLLAWLVAGLLLGVAHAASLWIAARRSNVTWLPLTGLLRLLVLGGALAGAALGGGILPAGAGWFVGFAGAVSALYMRRQR